MQMSTIDIDLYPPPPPKGNILSDACTRILFSFSDFLNYKACLLNQLSHKYCKTQMPYVKHWLKVPHLMLDSYMYNLCFKDISTPSQKIKGLTLICK